MLNQTCTRKECETSCDNVAVATFSDFKMQMRVMNSFNILHLAQIMAFSVSGTGVEAGAKAGAGKEAGAKADTKAGAKSGTGAGAGAGLGAGAVAQDRSYQSQFPCQCQPPSYRKPRDKDHVRINTCTSLGMINNK